MVDPLEPRSRSIDQLVLYVIILFVLSISALAQTQQQPLVGTQTIQASLDGDNSEMAEAFPVWATSSGQISSLSLYLDRSSTAATVWVGLYSSYAGHPLRLLSQAQIPQPTSGIWNSIRVPAVQVKQGRRYWLALLGLNGQIAFRDNPGNCYSETSQQTSLTSFPTTWRTGSQWSTCGVSMFGSGGAASNVSVTVSPTSASAQTRQQMQFTSTVSGTTNTAVTWTASGGTVSTNGQYTAPSSAGTYTVTATSAADYTKSASAVVTVSQPAQVSISVSPRTVSLQSGAQQQFGASVSGTSNTAVIWSASGGTVSTGGLYVAPSVAGTFTVTATSAADSSKSASAVVTVSQPAQVAISLSPATASLQTGTQQQFNASVSGTTNTGVTWTASGGTVSAGGLYVAPSVAGTFTVTATSAADSSKSASAVVTVSQPAQVAISLSPATASLQTGTQQQFNASVSGTTNTGVTWTASGGTVSAGGLYVAPSVAGTFTVTATSAADSSKSASAVVTVSQPAQVAISLSPATASLQTGRQQQFIASVSGTTNTGVTWTASGGTVSAGGLYVAPSVAGTFTVTATSAADSSKSASAVVTVSQPAQVAISLSPATASLQTGRQQQFIASVSGTTNTGVTWTASGGTVSAGGLYVAPSVAGTFTVTATSAADSSKSASAVVTVSQPAQVAISLSPATASLQTGAQQQFIASVSGTSNTAVTWSASGGTVSTSGLYVAPSTVGTYEVTAVSAADPTKSASATVSVFAPPTISIAISPTTVAMPQKWQQQFVVTVSGSSNTAVLWAVKQGTGTITQSGLYTAPQAVETDVITATSQADNTKSASATVSVVAPHVVSLNWSASTSPNVSYYKVYRGTVNGGPYTPLATNVRVTSYTDSSVQSGTTYYYVTTAVDSSGVESGYSDIAPAAIPMP